jgi:hypothetical protein
VIEAGSVKARRSVAGTPYRRVLGDGAEHSDPTCRKARDHGMLSDHSVTVPLIGICSVLAMLGFPGTIPQLRT